MVLPALDLANIESGKVRWKRLLAGGFPRIRLTERQEQGKDITHRSGLSAANSCFSTSSSWKSELNRNTLSQKSPTHSTITLGISGNAPLSGFLSGWAHTLSDFLASEFHTAPKQTHQKKYWKTNKHEGKKINWSKLKIKQRGKLFRRLSKQNGNHEKRKMLSNARWKTENCKKAAEARTFVWLFAFWKVFQVLTTHAPWLHPSPPHILRFTFSARFSTPFSGSLAKYLCKSSVGHLWTVKHSQRNSNEFDTLTFS